MSATDAQSAASLSLPNLIDAISSPRPALTYSDIHHITGEPPAARATLKAASEGHSWLAVGAAYQQTTIGAALHSSSTLLGHPTPPATVEAINAKRVRFCNAFPCEVRALAPALSSLNGLDTAIALPRHAPERATLPLHVRRSTTL